MSDEKKEPIVDVKEVDNGKKEEKKEKKLPKKGEVKKNKNLAAFMRKCNQNRKEAKLPEAYSEEEIKLYE